MNVHLKTFVLRTFSWVMGVYEGVSVSAFINGTVKKGMKIRLLFCTRQFLWVYV